MWSLWRGCAVYFCRLQVCLRYGLEVDLLSGHQVWMRWRWIHAESNQAQDNPADEMSIDKFRRKWVQAPNVASAIPRAIFVIYNKVIVQNMRIKWKILLPVNAMQGIFCVFCDFLHYCGNVNDENNIGDSPFGKWRRDERVKCLQETLPAWLDYEERDSVHHNGLEAAARCKIRHTQPRRP